MTLVARAVLAPVLLPATWVLAAESTPSALSPAGPQAVEIAQIWWLLLGGGIVIFVGVMTLVLAGLMRPRALPAWAGRAFIIGGGLAFPVLVLTALLVYTVVVGARLAAPAPHGTLTIDITGHMWWWDVRYGGVAGGALVTANELRIPVGRPVLLRVHAADVIHSFWVPQLAGKIDMIPGRVNQLLIQADRPGVFRGQCAEFCGRQHTLMALHVVAEPAADWERWFAQRRMPVAPVADASIERGRQLFMSVGCGACHAVRGVSDPPPGIAPDLTHVGSRPSLGAGVLPNTVGHMAAWIADSQAIKPGNGMPSFHHLDGPSLTTLAAYMESLR